MRKRVVGASPQRGSPVPPAWLDLQALASVEVTSEHPDHPIENALLREDAGGWRAAGPGAQTVRIVFDSPQRIQRIRLRFAEHAASRTQEFVLRWSEGGAQPLREIVRQQWNFSPDGATEEVEDYAVGLNAVGVLELRITPDISDGDAVAGLAELRLI
jgi:hypothetical protein